MKYIRCVVLCVFTRTDDACVEYREVLLAGGEGGYGEGATGLSAAAHPPLRWRAGTLSSCTHRDKKSFIVSCFCSTQILATHSWHMRWWVDITFLIWYHLLIPPEGVTKLTPAVMKGRVVIHRGRQTNFFKYKLCELTRIRSCFFLGSLLLFWIRHWIHWSCQNHEDLTYILADWHSVKIFVWLEIC